ncbi:MAG TPA: APC family permease [Edaphobacter sp.]|nr:APC family permease [Edaphobacter sp.]
MTTRLTRSLGLWELVCIGIILVQPTAPMPLFGVVQQEAHGHVVTAILLAMVAMLFTAISYGRMARAHPRAGSAYTYVGQEIHPALGYVTGWSMLMDYVLNPLICTIWCSKAAMNIVPLIPYWAWAVFFAALFTGLNLRNIRATARINAALAIAMGMVILAVLIASTRYVMGLPGLGMAYFSAPFYDPQTFSWPLVATGTSVAVLTYIGFDGISTLSEEVVDPRRNILLATVLICLTIGLLSAVEVYAAQLVWPAHEPFPDLDTAYVHVAGRIGGPILFQLVNLTLLVASIGSGSGGQLAGARLLYGMGRDNALPRSFFGVLDTRSHIPRNNVLLIGAICLIGAFVMTYQLGAEMLNFGAFIGFMGVNVSSFLHDYVRSQKKTISNLLPPLAGFVTCLAMWLSLRTAAKMFGFMWLLIGVLYGVWRTRSFRDPIRFEAPPE